MAKGTETIGARAAKKPARAAAASPKKTAKASGGRSLTEQAYDLLKHQILTCALCPGEYLNERRLCESLNIGRTPVHQAIGQLQQERLIDVIPRKGIIVRPVSVDEYLNLNEARLMFEVEAVRLAASRITPDEIDELNSILERSKIVRKQRDIEQILLLDRDFHLILAKSTRNTIMADILKSLYERSLRVWFGSLSSMHIEANREEHQRLVDALRAGDGDTAAEMMREHILSSRAYTMRSL